MFNKVRALLSVLPVFSAFITMKDKETHTKHKPSFKKSLLSIRAHSEHIRHQGAQERARRIKQLETGHRRQNHVM